MNFIDHFSPEELPEEKLEEPKKSFMLHTEKQYTAKRRFFLICFFFFFFADHPVHIVHIKTASNCSTKIIANFPVAVLRYLHYKFVQVFLE